MSSTSSPIQAAPIQITAIQPSPIRAVPNPPSPVPAGRPAAPAGSRRHGRLSRPLRQRNARIERYQQLVRPIALHYHLRCSEPLDDLVQVGLLGLLRASELYNRQRQTPFDAFARPHIRGAILHLQ